MPVPWKIREFRHLAGFQTIAPQVAAAGAAVNGVAIDTRSGPETGGAIVFFTIVGTRTGAVTSTINHQDSADGSTGWADIPGAVDLIDTTGDRVYRRAVKRGTRIKRYVRIMVNPVGGTSVAVCGLVLVVGRRAIAIQAAQT